MTTFRDDFSRQFIGNDYAETGWSIVAGGVRCTAPVPYGFLYRGYGNHAKVTAVHAENQVTGKIGVVARLQNGASWVRLVCEPSNGWTWTLEESTGYIYVNGQYILQTNILDQWPNLGPPAGRRTSILVRGPVIDAYLDEVLLGRYVDTARTHGITGDCGLSASSCTARIDELIVSTPNDGLVGSDHFDRTELGPTFPSGSPYVGGGDWEIIKLPATAGYVMAKVEAHDNQLVFDMSKHAYEIYTQLRTHNNSNEFGLIIRWSNALNFLGLSAQFNENRLSLIQVEDGVHSTIWTDQPVDSTYKYVQLAMVDDWIAIDFDYRPQAVVQTSFNQNATYGGVWANGIRGAFGTIYQRAFVWPAVLEPGAIEVNPTEDLVPTTALQPAKLRAHGGTLIYYIPPVLEPGAIQVTGGNLKLSDRLQPGKLHVHASNLAFLPPLALDGGPNNPAPAGSGHFPIHGPDGTESTGVIDEYGNVLVDEYGNILIFD